MGIGEKIKLMRIQKNLTQQELANRCELSKGFISQVERDLSSPSIATLTDILESLGTSLKEFFNDSENDKIVFSKEDVSVQEQDGMGQAICWIVPNAQKNMMEPILLKLKKNGRSDEYGPHAGEVFGYVAQGSIKLHVGGANHRVRMGESFYYTAKWTYHIENVSAKEAVVIWVTSPPNF
jgi:transcriptional regulator with XRE-family HTH domain